MLSGGLGAGKTTLAQGIGEGMGVLGRVASKMDKGEDVLAEAKRLEAERAAEQDAEDEPDDADGETADAGDAADEGLGEE